MLLGFVMSECDIEANPKKISAIMDMGPIKNLKGVGPEISPNTN
jgi:hypothetical protein